MPGCRALCHVLVGHASHPGTPSELHRFARGGWRSFSPRRVRNHRERQQQLPQRELWRSRMRCRSRMRRRNQRRRRLVVRRVQCRRVEARSRRRLLELQSALRARARGQQRSRKRLKQQPCSQTLQMRRRVLDRRREPVRLHIASLAICSRTGNIQRAERTGLRGHCMDFIYAILTEKWSSRMLNIMLILSAFKNSPFHSQKL